MRCKGLDIPCKRKDKSRHKQVRMQVDDEQNAPSDFDEHGHPSTRTEESDGDDDTRGSRPSEAEVDSDGDAVMTSTTSGPTLPKATAEPLTSGTHYVAQSVSGGRSQPIDVDVLPSSRRRNPKRYARPATPMRPVVMIPPRRPPTAPMLDEDLIATLNRKIKKVETSLEEEANARFNLMEAVGKHDCCVRFAKIDADEMAVKEHAMLQYFYKLATDDKPEKHRNDAKGASEVDETEED